MLIINQKKKSINGKLFFILFKQTEKESNKTRINKLNASMWNKKLTLMILLLTCEPEKQHVVNAIGLDSKPE